MNRKVVIDNEYLEQFKVISSMYSPYDDNIGILILGQDYFDTSRNVKLHFYLLNRELDTYYVHKQLQTLNFHSIFEANSFVGHLPEMSALELILFMGLDTSTVQ